MAGGGAPTPAKGGKRSIDFVVNLVPMLDLLSVLVSFLLITAVWTQLARINVGSVMPKGSTKPQEQQQKQKPLKILVDEKGVYIKFHGDARAEFIEVGEGMLPRIADHLKGLGFKDAQANTEQKVVLAVADPVFYSMLINVMDVCLDLGLTSISVVDKKAFEG